MEGTRGEHGAEQGGGVVLQAAHQDEQRLTGDPVVDIWEAFGGYKAEPLMTPQKPARELSPAEVAEVRSLVQHLRRHRNWDDTQFDLLTHTSNVEAKKIRSHRELKGRVQ